MSHSAAALANPLPLADVAVVLQTILRPSLLRSARSVFAQDFPGRIQLLVGVDVGDRSNGLLDTIRSECPSHVELTILDLGYSTSRRHSGFYSNHFGGALRTILSYAANSRYVAYLDDNDWYAADHLARLRRAIEGKGWAFSYRWLVDPETDLPICRDEWDSVGPGRGINKARFGGFVQPSTLMLDKEACHALLPLWCQAAFPDGGGEDRLIFGALNKSRAWAASDAHSCFCTLNAESIRHEHHTREFEARGLFWVTQRDLAAEMGRLMTAAGDADDLAAADAYRRVLAINPHHAQALHGAALVARRQGDLSDATEKMRAAIELEDGLESYHADYLQLLQQAGNALEAARVQATIRRRFGGTPSSHGLLQTTLARSAEEGYSPCELTP